VALFNIQPEVCDAFTDSASVSQAQQWDNWRRGYEQKLQPSEKLPPRDAKRQLDRRPWQEDDFTRYWEDAQWPERKARNALSSEGYRDRRDPYGDSMYGKPEAQNTDYRNPYRDHDDPDTDGFGDSNRFNNDSDYLSPAELHYKSRYRPVFFSRERYDEREQRWDDQTMGHGTYTNNARQPVTIQHGDISRWR
jgi:hypothetical protein